MKRRMFWILGGILPVAILLTGFTTGKPVREYYQLTIYHFTTAEQGKTINNYLQNALLPALHRLTINKAGVFEALANDTSVSKTLYVFFPVKSLDQVVSLTEKLNEDKDFQQAGATYTNAVYTDPPYTRMETILLRAFPLAPQMQAPALKASKKERVYELRSYESATEKIFKNKVQMFNDGDEIGLFKRLNFNAVFYSEVVAGAKMPNLMYMTSFENMADRDAHWKNFSADTAWKKLSSMPEYQHNVAHVDITFLRPAEYSDF
jgi:NIPSNAP